MALLPLILPLVLQRRAPCRCIGVSEGKHGYSYASELVYGPRTGCMGEYICTTRVIAGRPVYVSRTVAGRTVGTHQRSYTMYYDNSFGMWSISGGVGVAPICLISKSAAMVPDLIDASSWMSSRGSKVALQLGCNDCQPQPENPTATPTRNWRVISRPHPVVAATPPPEQRKPHFYVGEEVIIGGGSRYYFHGMRGKLVQLPTWTSKKYIVQFPRTAAVDSFKQAFARDLIMRGMCSCKMYRLLTPGHARSAAPTTSSPSKKPTPVPTTTQPTPMLTFAPYRERSFSSAPTTTPTPPTPRAIPTFKPSRSPTAHPTIWPTLVNGYSMPLDDDDD